MCKKGFFVLLILTGMAVSGCGLIDFVVGKDVRKVYASMDTNRDNKLDVDEIKASGYDTDGDGKMSEEEWLAATAPNPLMNTILTVAGGFAIPGLPIGVAGIRALQRRRKDVYALVSGIEKGVKHAKVNGGAITIENLYGYLNIARELLPHGKKLLAEIDKIKAAERAHAA